MCACFHRLLTSEFTETPLVVSLSFSSIVNVFAVKTFSLFLLRTSEEEKSMIISSVYSGDSNEADEREKNVHECFFVCLEHLWNVNYFIASLNLID